jgi:hypothetical protein
MILPLQLVLNLGVLPLNLASRAEPKNRGWQIFARDDPVCDPIHWM